MKKKKIYSNILCSSQNLQKSQKVGGNKDHCRTARQRFPLALAWSQALRLAPTAEAGHWTQLIDPLPSLLLGVSMVFPEGGQQTEVTRCGTLLSPHLTLRSLVGCHLWGRTESDTT